MWVGLLEGPALDWIVKRMAKRNNGVFEVRLLSATRRELCSTVFLTQPEFRLVFIIPQVRIATSCAGEQH